MDLYITTNPFYIFFESSTIVTVTLQSTWRSGAPYFENILNKCSATTRKFSLQMMTPMEFAAYIHQR